VVSSAVLLPLTSVTYSTLRSLPRRSNTTESPGG
jgi:hypothetical protein